MLIGADGEQIGDEPLTGALGILPERLLDLTRYSMRALDQGRIDPNRRELARQKHE